MHKFAVQGSLLFFPLVAKQNVVHHSMRNLSVILINATLSPEVMMPCLKEGVIFRKFFS